MHIKIGAGRGEGRLATDKSTRGPGGDRLSGVGGTDEDEELEDNGGEGKKTRKAEMETKLQELSTRPDLYELLSRSLAPSIWEMDDVKKGILLQLFGGTNKSVARGGGAGGPRYRGDINVLLVGDPGTSKSQILQVSLRYNLLPRILTPCLSSMSIRSHLGGCIHLGKGLPLWV